MDALPVVDLTAFRNDPSGPEGLAVVEELRRAAHEVGFVYLCGHGVDPNLDDAMFGTAREFFDLPGADHDGIGLRVFGENNLKTRLRSHPDVARRHYADLA